MLIGLFTLLLGIFGVGSEDVFYLDKIDKGIKKYVTDQERKKELQGDLKNYTKALNQFAKILKGHLKELKKKNHDRNTTRQWYVDFFDSRMEERKELQALFIDQRSNLQKNITEDEWTEIMQMATKEANKVEGKEQKKELKQKSKNIFENQEQVIKDVIFDPDKKSKVQEALRTYEQEFIEAQEAYGDININETDFLADKNASKADMQKFADNLNVQTINMYKAYMDFLMEMKENTNDEEWASIIKVFNKGV